MLGLVKIFMGHWQDDRPLEECIADSRSVPPWEEMDRMEFHDNLETLMDILSDEERKVVEMRFGFSCEKSTLQEIGQVLDFPVEGGAQSGRAWAQDASDEDRRFAGLMAGNHELASVWWGDFVLEDWDGSLCHALFMLGFLRGATEACEEMKQ